MTLEPSKSLAHATGPHVARTDSFLDLEYSWTPTRGAQLTAGYTVNTYSKPPLYYTLGAVAPLLPCLRTAAVLRTAHALGPGGPLPHATPIYLWADLLIARLAPRIRWADLFIVRTLRLTRLTTSQIDSTQL